MRWRMERIDVAGWFASPALPRRRCLLLIQDLKNARFIDSSLLRAQALAREALFPQTDRWMAHIGIDDVVVVTVTAQNVNTPEIAWVIAHHQIIPGTGDQGSRSDQYRMLKRWMPSLRSPRISRGRKCRENCRASPGSDGTSPSFSAASQAAKGEIPNAR